MLSLPKIVFWLTVSAILCLSLASPATGQGHCRGPHAHGNYVVASFAPVAAKYRPGNFTRMFADYYVTPYAHTRSALPYFPRHATPGLFQSYYRPDPILFDPIFSARIIPLDSNSVLYGSTSDSQPISVRPASAELKRRPSRTFDFGQTTAPRNLISTKHDAADFQRLAEQAFRNGEFYDAIRHVNHGLIEDHENGKLYLFTAHASIATGEYRAAVDQLETATSLLHQNQWDFVIRNRFEIFEQVSYQTGIDELANYLTQNPNSVDAIVLKGFHLGCLGMLEQSQIELATALSLEPQHVLAGRLMSAQKLPITTATTPAFPVETRLEAIPRIDLGRDLSQPPRANNIELLPVPAILEEEEEIEALPVTPEAPAQDWLDLEPTLELDPQPESVLQLDDN